MSSEDIKIIQEIDNKPIKNSAEDENIKENQPIKKIIIKNEDKIAINNDVEIINNDEQINVRKRRSSDCNNAILEKRQKSRRKSSNDLTQVNSLTNNSVASNNNSTIVPINEVESELEKMFAGIETNADDSKNDEDENMGAVDLSMDTSNKIKSLAASGQVTVNNVSNSECRTKILNDTEQLVDNETVKEDNKKKGKGKEKQNKKVRDRKKERLKQAASKKTKPDTITEADTDSVSNLSSSKSKVPVVHLVNPKVSPLNVLVVNGFREDEEDKAKDKKKNLSSSFHNRSKKLPIQNTSSNNYNPRLYNSTLSLRYDSVTPDKTWVCVFCKQGPHYIILKGTENEAEGNVVFAGVLSDLFGPYVINKTVEPQQPGTNLDLSNNTTQQRKKENKNKKKQIQTDANNSCQSINYFGMVRLTDQDERWEVWVHEQCAIWTTGIYITGGRVVGLEESVWDVNDSICETCGLTGANINCTHRTCKAVTHYACGVKTGWNFNKDQYISKCQIH